MEWPVKHFYGFVPFQKDQRRIFLYAVIEGAICLSLNKVKELCVKEAQP